MEKRKLAKIPREEASDEMVRFAERAAGTHIVTTKDIEKDLLMVTFYPIRKLKKGKKDAQLRTFFSKNDYISQDLTVEKVKWLTAAYDRMYDISLYEHHWDYKESTGRWTPNMFFWTDADIDRMRSFFKEWSTEKDVKDWTAVERFQNMVRQKRLDERHAKETNPIDSVMETVKEIPEDFKKWVSEKAMSFSRYLIYSARSKNEALVRCTHCNEVTLVDRTKIRLRNNEKGICPLCGSPVTIKARGRMPMHIWDERIVSFIEPREEGFLWRYFTAHREVKPDGKINDGLFEIVRTFYKFGCNTTLIRKENRHSTIHKICRYIEREGSDYRVGERGGCWRYSYMQHKERPDIREERLQNCAKDWLDYLAWCKELKYDLTNMFFYFPKNFKKVHDRTAAEYQAVQDKKAAEKKRREEERIKREAEVMKKLLEEMLKENAGIDNAFLIKGKGLILRVPRDAQEIKNEGAALHHCVGTYVDRVAKGQTHIFFVRRVEEPDTPYFTMEYNNGRVIQCRGSHNCGMPASVKTFVAAFEKLMKEREEKMERKCG